MSLFRQQLNRWLLRYRYRLDRTHRPHLFGILLTSYLERCGRKATFIQIGANDGVRFDPLHEFIRSSRYRMEGVVVEPVPRFFLALERTYADQTEIVAVNTAVHNSKTSARLYVVREECEHELPEWVRGIASFDYCHLTRSGLPKACIEEIRVPCTPLDAIAEQYNLLCPDLIQIDTEGYDTEIIRGMDLTHFRPAMIHFEHGLPDQVMTEKDFEQLTVLLNGHGYQILRERYDALAIRNDVPL